MEQFEKREIARLCHVQQKSIDTALAAGVEEVAIVDFFEARAAGGFEWETHKYTPSVRSSLAAYHACEGDTELMKSVSVAAKEQSLQEVKDFAEEVDSELIDRTDVAGIGRHNFDQILADVRDEWFERQASERSRESGRGIDYEKYTLYEELGMQVFRRTRSTIQRLTRHLTSVAFLDGFSADFDQHPIHAVIEEDPNVILYLSRHFDLKGKELRAAATAFTDPEVVKIMTELKPLISNFITPNLPRQIEAQLVAVMCTNAMRYSGAEAELSESDLVEAAKNHLIVIRDTIMQAITPDLALKNPHNDPDVVRFAINGAVSQKVVNAVADVAVKSFDFMSDIKPEVLLAIMISPDDDMPKALLRKKAIYRFAYRAFITSDTSAQDVYSFLAGIGIPKNIADEALTMPVVKRVWEAGISLRREERAQLEDYQRALAGEPPKDT